MKTLSQITLPRAILFDHDGVLVASEPVHWAAWRRLIEKMGLPFMEADVRGLVGKTGPQIMAALLDRYQPGWTRDEHDLDALALQKNDFYLEEMKLALQPYPGVIDGLNWLRAEGVKTAVVSNARRRELLAALDSLSMTPLFDVLISRDDVQPPKPDPAPFLFGAASVGVNPSDCLAVEDSPPGIESALVGRIPAAAVLTNFSRTVMEMPVPGRPDLRPIWVGESMLEFFDWLKGLPRRPQEA